MKEGRQAGIKGEVEERRKARKEGRKEGGN
jgi:hypothetical protein